MRREMQRQEVFDDNRELPAQRQRPDPEQPVALGAGSADQRSDSRPSSNGLDSKVRFCCVDVWLCSYQLSVVQLYQRLSNQRQS